MRSPCTTTKSSPCLPQLEKARMATKTCSLSWNTKNKQKTSFWNAVLSPQVLTFVICKLSFSTLLSIRINQDPKNPWASVFNPQTTKQCSILTGNIVHKEYMSSTSFTQKELWMFLRSWSPLEMDFQGQGPLPMPPTSNSPISPTPQPLWQVHIARERAKRESDLRSEDLVLVPTTLLGFLDKSINFSGTCAQWREWTKWFLKSPARFQICLKYIEYC